MNVDHVLIRRLVGKPHVVHIKAMAMEAMNDASMLAGLFRIIYSGDDSLRWRAAWVIEKVCDKNPSLVSSERKKLVAMLLGNTPSDGLSRLLLSILHKLPEDEEFDVAFFNYLIGTMVDMKATSGVQALAMKLADRISRKEPELHREFLCIVRAMELEYYTAGVCSVIRSCLRKYKNE